MLMGGERVARSAANNMNALAKNVLLWIVIVLVMTAVFSRYMQPARPSALSANLKLNRADHAPQTCLTTSGGEVICPPPNGSIAADAAGRAVCGRGECSKDTDGRWLCSTESGGYVGRNGAGKVVCTGGCEPASGSLCEAGR